jgi:hypothetical protein
MNTDPNLLLQEAEHAANLGMYSLAAAKARRAAIILQERADKRKHEALCLRTIGPRIEFEPVEEFISINPRGDIE